MTRLSFYKAGCWRDSFAKYDSVNEISVINIIILTNCDVTNNEITPKIPHASQYDNTIWI